MTGTLVLLKLSVAILAQAFWLTRACCRRSRSTLSLLIMAMIAMVTAMQNSDDFTSTMEALLGDLEASEEEFEANPLVEDEQPAAAAEASDLGTVVNARPRWDTVELQQRV